jgi:hypothetical protein
MDWEYRFEIRYSPGAAHIIIQRHHITDPPDRWREYLWMVGNDATDAMRKIEDHMAWLIENDYDPEWDFRDTYEH